MFDWLVFGVSAGVVVGAGITIGRISGEIGERLGLGRVWSGAVLLSVATTLPEAVTTLTVAARGAYGMAVGGILGSILFNLFILVVVDVVDPEPLYHRLSKNHLATGLLGAALLGIVLAGLSLSQARTARLAAFDASVGSAVRRVSRRLTCSLGGATRGSRQPIRRTGCASAVAIW